MKLLSRKEIIKNKIQFSPSLQYAGIYFLINKNKIVYVGQTMSSFAERILSHIKAKKIKFDSYSTIPILLISKDKSSYTFIKESNFFSPIETSIPHLDFKGRLNLLEARYIFKFMPKYNSALPKQKKYMAKTHLKNTIEDINWRKIQEGVKEKKIIPILKWDCVYYKIAEIEKYLKFSLLKKKTFKGGI